MKPITPELLAKIHAATRSHKNSILKVPSLNEAGSNIIVDAAIDTEANSSNSIVDGAASEISDMDSKHTIAEEVLEDINVEEFLESSKPPIENGIYEVKNDLGKTVQKLCYEHGKLNGEGQVFDENGNPIQTVSYVNGKKEGPLKIYGSQGQLLSIIPYQNDQRSGTGVFYVLGAKTAEMSFQHDALEGPSVFYHSNGSIAAVLNYKNNMLQGRMECFDMQQCLVRSSFYKGGKLQGESITYYPGGIKIFEKGLFDQDKPIGKHWKFYEDQHVQSLQEYDQGKLVKDQYYDPQGNIIEKPKSILTETPLPISFTNMADNLHSI